MHSTRNGVGFLAHRSKLRIGTRLTACFGVIVLSMIAADGVAVWQFRRMTPPIQHLMDADQISLAVTRVHLDIEEFSATVAALASNHETGQFVAEAMSVREKFLADVEQAGQLMKISPTMGRDATISSALQTLTVTLPSQLDAEVGLATAGDWEAVQRRLTEQIKDYVNLSSLLVKKVDEQVLQERTLAVENTEQARRNFFLIVPIAGLLTLLAAAALGWYVTRTITVPLSELTTAAQELARGNFQHQVGVEGDDELTVLGNAFNHAARQLQELYEGLREQASLLSLTHDGVYVRDMKGVIRYWNRGAEVLYGWPAQHAVGKVARELLKAVSSPPFEQIEAELLRTGRWEGELVKTKKDGTQLVVASRCSLKRDDRGEPVAILVTSNDITERKRAEEALSRLNRELRAISNCNQTLLRATDEQSLLKEICRIVCEEAGYRMAWVAYAEHDEAKSVRPVAWTGAEEGYLASTGTTWADTERGRGPTGTAIRSGETCCIQDCATDPRVAPWREGILQRDFRSAIALPLKDEHANTFGSLSIYSAQPNAFTSEEVRLLEELAGDMAFGIVNLRSRAARKQADQALRQSEAYLAEAQRLSHTGSWAFDVASGNYVYSSEEYLRICGFDPQQGLPAKDQSLQQIHRDDLDKFLQAFQKLIDEKVDSEGEYRIVLPDGTVKYVHAIRHPVLNANGELVEIVGTTVDITERKRAEEALRRSEAYLTEAQRLTHTGAWATDAAPEPSYWSEELFRLYGLDPQGGLPTHDQAMQRVHPEDRDKYVQAFHRAIHQKVDSDVEFRTVLPDGTVKHLHGIGHPVLNAHGELVEVVGTTVNITERKRAEEALREGETRFRTFVDHAGDALFVYDLEQRIVVDVNREACESLGYSREELIGKSPLAFHLDSYQAEMESIADRAVAGETVIDRHWHRRRDGSLFPVEVHTSVIFYGGRRFLLMVARDVTDRVRAEEQHEKLRQLEADLAHIDRVSILGELAASIAHEINQPLAGIVSSGSACLRWLARDVPDLEEAREAARRIVRDGKRAGEIIARIRALTKKAVASGEKLDLNKTIREVLALVGDEAKRNSVVIQTRFGDDVFPVLGDQVQLQQVVLNLVMNAIQAMSSVADRARELVITTRNIDADEVEVTVEDSGIGIDPQMLDKVFESFYTTKPGGMGMGLSISRSILRAHGGRLWATGKDGTGTIFHFTLPKYHEEESNGGVTAA